MLQLLMRFGFVYFEIIGLQVSISNNKKLLTYLFVGFSESRMSISEIGVSFPDKSFGSESRFGNPFTVRQPETFSIDRLSMRNIKDYERQSVISSSWARLSR